MPTDTEMDAAEEEADALFCLYVRAKHRPLGWLLDAHLERSRDSLWCLMQEADDREVRGP